VLKEAADLIYTVESLEQVLFANGLIIAPENGERIEELIKTASKIFGPHAVLEAIKRVHQSNMSKLGDDGKPVWREDGKVLKGPNYKSPDLTDLVLPIFNDISYDY
jgi:hypothetical protein